MVFKLIGKLFNKPTKEDNDNFVSLWTALEDGDITSINRYAKTGVDMNDSFLIERLAINKDVEVIEAFAVNGTKINKIRKHKYCSNHDILDEVVRRLNICNDK